MKDGLALIGTPDEVRDGLRQYVEATGHQRILR
jgi:alkanesulfonate monooxygenase SsuD/methylene tetrahydromethanopterin reductase-like flavin-dependent oxidoreductase (luciferase family)